jgi:hypothetical protein
MHEKNIYTNHMHYAGVFWYFSSPYWKWLYLTLSEIELTFSVKVVYGKHAQYRFDRHGLFKESVIKVCIV